MLRIAPRMIFVLLCGTMLAGCASTAHPDVAKLTGGDTQAGHAKKEAAAIDKTAPTDLEGGVRQAQLMRLAGHYDDAIHVLSQLMLVASDDPRVVAEYGKTLAQKGRAQDAVEFLNRGIELSSNDWTLYSALGVSYDQLGNQVSARAAYEHALALRPEEPSVLNNYALSRMLAGDTEGARILIGRAERAGGAGDAKIASNIALLNKIDPAPAAPQNVAVANKSAAMPAAMPPAMPVRQAAPVAASAPPAAMPRPQPVRAPVAQNAPRPIMPIQQQQQQPRVAMAPMQPSGVVMQAVPFDPLAGPVKPVVHAPRVATAALVPPKIVIAPEPPAAKPAAVKTADAKTADPKSGVKAIPVKAAAKDQIPALRMSANAY
jgi:Flp pilus assembly protein TadD